MEARNKTMKKRVVYRVQWRKREKLWVLTCGGHIICGRNRQRLAYLIGCTKARHTWEQWGDRAQLVVHKRNGVIRTEHTYGDDPRRTKG